MIVEDVKAYWVLDSRGNPTVEVLLSSGNVRATGASPSGASTGSKEALELRDKDKDFHGKGVKKAIKNVLDIKEKIKGRNFENPFDFDRFIIELDGTPNKSNLGGNASTALSIAFYKLYSKLNEIPIYEIFPEKNNYPKLMFNIINGGKHAGNSLSVQEFMIVPLFEKPSENIKAASEIYHELKKEIASKYGKIYTGVGDEGGFAPPVKNTSEAIELLEKSITSAGYSDNVKVSLDCAADSFYEKNSGLYRIDGLELRGEELVDYYKEISHSFDLLSIEDPFFETDVESFAELRKVSKSLIIGDDITVTNTHFIKNAYDKDAIDGVIIKINQIGSVYEALEAARFCSKNSLRRIVSHRSGETEDSFISDFAFGIGSEFIKTGAPARGERTSKYNRLLRIEVEHG